MPPQLGQLITQPPTPYRSRLSTMIRTKFPGQYDDLDDKTLEDLITKKFPGQYDDLVGQEPTAVRKPTQMIGNPAGTVPGFLEGAYNKVVDVGKGILNLPFQGGQLFRDSKLIENVAAAKRAGKDVKLGSPEFTRLANEDPALSNTMAGGLDYALGPISGLEQSLKSGDYGGAAVEGLMVGGQLLGMNALRNKRVAPPKTNTVTSPPVTKVEPTASVLELPDPNPQPISPYSPATIGPLKETGEVTSRPYGINNRDFLASDPLMAHVPNVVRPEAPMVKWMRDRLPAAIREKVEPGNFANQRGVLDPVEPITTPLQSSPEVRPVGSSAVPKVPKASKAKEPPTYVNEEARRLKNFGESNPQFDALYQRWVKDRAATSQEAAGVRDRFGKMPGKEMVEEGLPSDAGVLDLTPKKKSFWHEDELSPQEKLDNIALDHGDTVKRFETKLEKIKGMDPKDIVWGRDWQNDTRVHSIKQAEAEIQYFKDRQAKAIENAKRGPLPKDAGVVDIGALAKGNRKNRPKTIDEYTKSKEDVVKFHEEMKAGHHPEITKYFEDKYAELTDKGVELGKKGDYLPQLWEEKSNQIAAKLGEKYASENATMTYRSVIEDYKTGVEKGLTPRMSPIELLEWYEKRGNQLVADRNFIKEMQKSGQMVKGEAPAGWKTLDVDRFPGEWKVHPRVHEAIENYMKPDPSKALHLSAEVSGKAKSIALSSGVWKDKPLLTAHGINMTRAAWKQGGIKGLSDAVKFGLNPKKASEFMKANRGEAIQAVKDGVTLAVEDPQFRVDHIFEGTDMGLPKKAINKVVELQHRFFEKPLFEQMIPALKLKAYQRLKAGGMEGTKAAKQLNDFFGGINYDSLYRNKNYQNLARTVFLAPDWLESRLKVAKGTLKGDPKYMAAAGRAMAVYTAANVMQKILSGKFMVENEGNKQFVIDSGDSGDKNRWLDLFGTEEDPITGAVKSVTGLKSGEGTLSDLKDVIGGKLGFLPRLIFDFYNGEDYAGNKLITGRNDVYDRDSGTMDKLKNSALYLNQYMPQYLKGLIDFGSQRSNFEQALLSGTEMPFKYTKKKKPESMFNLPSVKAPSFKF